VKVGGWFTYVQPGNGELACAQVDYVERHYPQGAFAIHTIGGSGMLWFYPSDENIRWTRAVCGEDLLALLAASALADAVTP